MLNPSRRRHLSCDTKQDFSKILLIGIDGACWRVLTPLIKAEKLKNISRLIKDGCCGELKTIFPTVSPAIWTSIATGKNPRKHGIRDFITISLPWTKKRFQPRAFPIHELITIPGINRLFTAKNPFLNINITNSTLRISKTVWEILSDYGCSVGVVSWLRTWPVNPINGFIVSDLTFSRSVADKFLNKEFFTMHSQSFTHPEGLILEIEKFISGSEAQREKYPFSGQDTKVFKVGIQLLRKYNPRFFAIYFHELDALQHRYWKHRHNKNLIDEHYIYLDKIIGDFIKISGQDALIIIVSDHGIRAVPKIFQALNGISGWHKFCPPGILIMAGKHIKKKYQIKKAGIFDIIPTILYLLGYPIGSDMDGKILLDTIEEKFLKENPPGYISSYEKGIKSKTMIEIPQSINDEVKENLRSLGYL